MPPPSGAAVGSPADPRRAKADRSCSSLRMTIASATPSLSTWSPPGTDAAVPDGHQAVDALLGGPEPDLVVLDLVMPRMDGWAVLKWLKADQHHADRPVLVMSATAHAGNSPVVRSRHADRAREIAESLLPGASRILRGARARAVASLATLQVAERWFRTDHALARHRLE